MVGREYIRVYKLTSEYEHIFLTHLCFQFLPNCSAKPKRYVHRRSKGYPYLKEASTSLLNLTSDRQLFFPRETVEVRHGAAPGWLKCKGVKRKRRQKKQKRRKKEKKEDKKQQKKNYSTLPSRLVSDVSTTKACWGLRSQSGRDAR